MRICERIIGCAPSIAGLSGHRVGRAVRAPTRSPVALVLLALMASLSACATYEARPLEPAQSARTFAARRLDSPQLHIAVEATLPHAFASWPPRTWNRAGLLAVALVQNPQLAIARAEIDAALAQRISAVEMPNPDLRLQSEYASEESRSWLYGIGFDFVLRSQRRKRLDIGIAELVTTNARAKLLEETWIVRRTLVAALSAWEGARRRADLLDRIALAQQDLMDLRELRVKAGEDAPGDRVTTRSALLEVRQQIAQTRAEADAAQSSLAAVLAMPPAALDGLQYDWAEWGTPLDPDAAALSRAREQALLGRADLAALMGDYASAEMQLERAVVRQYPEFRFSPGYYWDHGIAKWPLDVAFNLPVFNRNQGEIAQARAARELAAQRMLGAQATIQGAIDAAVRADAIATRNADVAQRRVDAMSEQQRDAVLALRLGAIDRGERLAADVLALRSELDALQARSDKQVARNALEDALHVPLSGPEIDLLPTRSTAPTDARPTSEQEPRP